jgi:phenylalanyl-tRNA synthetase alpha chain
VPPADGILHTELMRVAGANAKIGFSKAIAAGWIVLDKSADGGARVRRKVEHIDDAVREQLRCVRDGRAVDALTDVQRADFKKRKLLMERLAKCNF